MVHETSIDPALTHRLMARQQAIRDVRDAVAAVTDAIGHPRGLEEWRGPSSDNLERALVECAARLRSALPELDEAEATVRRWKNEL